MTRNLVKLGVAAMLLAAAAMPAQAGMVNEFNGVNFNYTMTVGGNFSMNSMPNAAIDVTFTTANMVTAINNNPAVLNVAFADLFSTLTSITAPDSNGNVQIGTNPSPGGTLGIQDFSGVVFDYNSVVGQTSNQTVLGNTTYTLTLGGSINIDTGLTNGTTLTIGATTYDFSPFLPPDLGSFTLQLNSSQNIIADLQAAAAEPPGSTTTYTFSGSGAFVADVTVIPEPASITLLGIGSVMASAMVRRRRSK